jgi:hypothetical protein
VPETQEMSLDQYISNYGKEFAKKSAHDKSYRSRSNLSGRVSDNSRISGMSYEKEDVSPADNIL